MSNVNQETIADIVAWIRRHASVYGYDLADRIEAAANRGDDVWRAAFAKVTSVVSRQHAKRNLGEQGSRAVAEIMSACRFADGALDEYERAFAAAPELYEALAALLNCAEKEAPFTMESGMSIAMDMARKAIEKAGGAE